MTASRSQQLHQADWMERMIYACVMVVVVFLWIMKMVLFPHAVPVSEAAEQGSTDQSVSGPSITHQPFSVKGTMVLTEHDNVQMFEYSNARAAASDVEAFKKSYDQIKSTNIWKSSIHLYQKDNVIVFYMGTREKVISPLTAKMGTAVIGGSAFVEAN
jgi:hypothetical protein